MKCYVEKIIIVEKFSTREETSQNFIAYFSQISSFLHNLQFPIHSINEKNICYNLLLFFLSRNCIKN